MQKSKAKNTGEAFVRRFMQQAFFLSKIFAEISGADNRE